MNKEEIYQEYIKCHQDSAYALNTYLETYDNTQNKYVTFKLLPEQKIIIHQIIKVRLILVLQIQNILHLQSTIRKPQRAG